MKKAACGLHCGFLPRTFGLPSSRPLLHSDARIMSRCVRRVKWGMGGRPQPARMVIPLNRSAERDDHVLRHHSQPGIRRILRACL